MELIKVDIKKFRCLKDVSIPFRELTVLIGENDAGKSSVLDLLDLILNERQPEDSDYYFYEDRTEDREDRAEEIEAILTFRPYPNQEIPREILSPDKYCLLKKRFTRESEETWVHGRRYRLSK